MIRDMMGKESMKVEGMDREVGEEGEEVSIRREWAPVLWEVEVEGEGRVGRLLLMSRKECRRGSLGGCE